MYTVSKMINRLKDVGDVPDDTVGKIDQEVEGPGVSRVQSLS